MSGCCGSSPRRAPAHRVRQPAPRPGSRRLPAAPAHPVRARAPSRLRRSFPLDRGGRLAADVVDDAGDATQLVDDAVGDAAEELVRQVRPVRGHRSEEQTSELQSLMRITYAVFCLKKQKKT